MAENRDAPAAQRGRGPTVAQQGARHDLSSRRDIDKLMAKLGTMPRILCWKCRKLTPFELDRCQHCGSAFAGGTGGAYGSRHAAASRTISVPKESPAPPKRTFTEIFEDLQRVHDVSASTRGRPWEKEVSLHDYQCPVCGRSVSEQATECACGVRFATSPDVAFTCPECASHLPNEVDACPVCGVRFGRPGAEDDYVYACPRCGAHIASDAVRCSCGAWFED